MGIRSLPALSALLAVVLASVGGAAASEDTAHESTVFAPGTFRIGQRLRTEVVETDAYDGCLASCFEHLLVEGLGHFLLRRDEMGDIHFGTALAGDGIENFSEDFAGPITPSNRGSLAPSGAIGIAVVRGVIGGDGDSCESPCAVLLDMGNAGQFLVIQSATRPSMVVAAFRAGVQYSQSSSSLNERFPSLAFRHPTEPSTGSLSTPGGDTTSIDTCPNDDGTGLPSCAVSSPTSPRPAVVVAAPPG